MAWDSSRPVPWQRLVREWLVYVGIMAVVFALFLRGTGLVGATGGLLVSGPLYLAVGYVLAKFGYQRKSLKELRSDREPSRDDADGSAIPSTGRPRPPATRRTSTGRNRPTSKQKRR